MVFPVGRWHRNAGLSPNPGLPGPALSRAADEARRAETGGTITSYMLPLSTLHAAAPGVFDVVFGPDGDSEKAPDWIGPVWCWSPAWGPESRAATFRPVFRVYPHAVGHENYSGSTRFEHAALDLRVPAVAARMAGLCARALDLWSVGPFDGAWGVRLVTDESGAFAWALCCAGWGRHLLPGDLVPQGASFGEGDEAAFVAALTLALAPRIAALRPTS